LIERQEPFIHLIGRPQNRAYFEYLVDLAGSGEQRPERVQLRHDAADSPQVDGRVVVDGVQQDLGRPVPPCGHVIGVRRTRPGFPGQPEIGDLHQLGTAAQEVLRLHVSVEKPVPVHERQSLEYLGTAKQFEHNEFQRGA